MEQTANQAQPLAQVDRRSNLSVAEFRREYLRPQRPVVITDAIDHWPARSLWTMDYFHDHLGAAEVTTHRYDPDREFTPGDVHKMTLADYVEGVCSRSLEAFPYYLRDNWRLFHEHPELMQHHDVPPYFFDWFKLLPRFMRLPYPRIFIGPAGAITPLHVDIWGTHAWLSQLVGRKRWLLFPPDQAEYLHGYDVRCEAPDYQAHPRYREARPLETVIEPGDTIWVPGNWAHWVHSLEAGISLTYNYMGPGCLGSCLTHAFREAFSPERLRRAITTRLPLGPAPQ